MGIAIEKIPRLQSGPDSSSLPPGGFSYPGSPPSIGTTRKTEPPAGVQTTPPRLRRRQKRGLKPPQVPHLIRRRMTRQEIPKPRKEPAPWLPLIGTLLALFASLGANVYSGGTLWRCAANIARSLCSYTPVESLCACLLRPATAPLRVLRHALQ